MLELKQIKKEYPAGDGVVHALRGVDLRFRKSEFVSILGPSGCGKTTMLNIIGGLDQYTDGDLVINGRTTKDFKDRDWDSYRNHSIGFVFQSYNLIPHQTVLQNVELALTLSGVSKAERRERAKKALADVGLESQLNKRPSEMSGGQMQRVAIARALVNDPDIILADEPTGALDTVTSVQVMEILKKISKDKLIIMVTHNPELAEKYSSRIINILDGEITGDSNPLTEEEYKAEQEADKAQIEQAKGKKVKKPSMSFGTAFSLSLKNLLTKKGRTMLTSFAGSIGIIGIALILALSQGFTLYIDSVQENALSAYPLTIESKVMDLSSLMETMLGKSSASQSHKKDAVYTKPIFQDLVNAMSASNQSENDLKSFKKYIDGELADNESELHKAVSGVQYSYDLNMQVYTKNVDGDIILSDPNKLMMEIMQEAMGVDMSSMMDMRESYMSSSGMGSMFSTQVVLWQEMLANDNGEGISDLLKEQYDVVYGEWPKEYNEIVLVLDENNELDDLTLYALGLESHEQMKDLMDAAMNQKEAKKNDGKWSYEDICGMEFRTVLGSDCYTYNKDTKTYSDLRNTDTGMKYLYDNGIPLKVTGIIRPNEDAQTTMLTGSIGYTKALTDYVIEKSQDTDVVKAQLESKDTDVLTGLPFKSEDKELTNEEKQQKLADYIAGLSETEKADAYVKIMSLPTEEEINALIEQMSAMTKEQKEAMIKQAIAGEAEMDEETLNQYLASMSDDDFTQMIQQAAPEYLKETKGKEVEKQLGAMSTKDLAAALDAALDTYTADQSAAYYDEVVPQDYSESTYEDILSELGYVDLDTPSSINLYASTFENKDVITDAIKDYNKGVKEEQEITYTDYIGIMMSSMTTIINTITYVLIAFVAISLVVSSIMIGVITLISVQERTKEIGILRAIGASKRDVSSMFNAETMIIGFSSGLLGVLVTYLLCIPINLIIHHLTGINNLSAYLPPVAAVILVAISVALTLISGLIPSRSAAKKDPVVALRSE